MLDGAPQWSPRSPWATLGSAAEPWEALAAGAKRPRLSLAHPAAPHSLANGAASNVCRIHGSVMETLPHPGALHSGVVKSSFSRWTAGLYIAFIPYS